MSSLNLLWSISSMLQKYEYRRVMNCLWGCRCCPAVLKSTLTRVRCNIFNGNWHDEMSLCSRYLQIKWGNRLSGFNELRLAGGAPCGTNNVIEFMVHTDLLSQSELGKWTNFNCFSTDLSYLVYNTPNYNFILKNVCVGAKRVVPTLILV
jgi:hypothetical protein